MIPFIFFWSFRISRAPSSGIWPFIQFSSHVDFYHNGHGATTESIRLLHMDGSDRLTIFLFCFVFLMKAGLLCLNNLYQAGDQAQGKKDLSHVLMISQMIPTALLSGPGPKSWDGPLFVVLISCLGFEFHDRWRERIMVRSRTRLSLLIDRACVPDGKIATAWIKLFHGLLPIWIPGHSNYLLAIGGLKFSIPWNGAMDIFPSGQRIHDTKKQAYFLLLWTLYLPMDHRSGTGDHSHCSGQGRVTRAIVTLMKIRIDASLLHHLVRYSTVLPRNNLQSAKLVPNTI
ncbi:hypothetical protein BX600DRAFT_114382 [Xylariales sp. PMI_506]|nr:hypothetical protein BX600DRAFT_114382 [Xylariales sp. PMI_506]